MAQVVEPPLLSASEQDETAPLMHARLSVTLSPRYYVVLPNIALLLLE